MSQLTDKQVIKVIANNQLSNQNSTTLSDDSYLVEKLTNKVRIMWRRQKGEKCTQVNSESDVIPKGAQSFTFAECKVFKPNYESKLDIMVPEVFLNASVKAVFPIVINGGFATFKDRPMDKKAVEAYLADEVEA